MGDDAQHVGLAMRAILVRRRDLRTPKGGAVWGGENELLGSVGMPDIGHGSACGVLIGSRSSAGAPAQEAGHPVESECRQHFPLILYVLYDQAEFSHGTL